MSEPMCDHFGECPPQVNGCQWVQFERAYSFCECGGWDERWVSRIGRIRLAGRSNHSRSCASRLTKADQ